MSEHDALGNTGRSAGVHDHGSVLKHNSILKGNSSQIALLCNWIAVYGSGSRLFFDTKKKFKTKFLFLFKFMFTVKKILSRK